MKIHINFDDPDFVSLNESKNYAVFQICWEEDGIFYPDKIWDDFGLTILGFWISTIQDLLNGEKESEFVFMDGPYSILIKYKPTTKEVKLFPKGLETVWKSNIVIIIEELIAALDKVNAELKNRQVFHEYQNSIRKKGIKILKECLAKLESEKN